MLFLSKSAPSFALNSEFEGMELSLFTTYWASTGSLGVATGYYSTVLIVYLYFLQYFQKSTTATSIIITTPAGTPT